MKKEMDLTTGSVPKKLITFALPLLLANLLQSFYSIVDMIVVGNIVGKTGLAAISNASMISFIINSLCIGFTMGGSVLIAQYKGANDKQGQIETTGTLLGISLITSFIVTLIALFVYEPIFQILDVPVSSMQDACEYMKIICYGTVFVFGYNAVCSIMKGFGNSKAPLYFIAIATIVNIILDLIFVGIFNMGTIGAAYATVISQAASLIISVFYLKRKMVIFDFKPKHFIIKTDKLISILKVGLPTAVQMTIVNISYLLITGMLNKFGVSVAASAGIGLKVNTFAGMPCWAIGQAVTSMAGQNMGANNIERVKKTTEFGLYINVFITLISVAAIQLFAEQIIILFEPKSAEVIKNGILYIRICCNINSLIYAVMYTFDSFAIGIGYANVAMVNSLLEAVFIRLSVSYLLAFTANMGFIGIYIGQALSPVLPAVVGLIYFKSKIWQNNKLIFENIIN